MASVSIRQIRAVIAVCEEASFTRAAEREFATQSGISQRIASLETTLGVKLFERSIDGVRPTPAGLCYYNRCLEAVRAIRAATDDIRALQEQTTSYLRVGLTPIFAATALAPTLKLYMQENPGVKLKVVEGYSGTLIEKLAAEDLDFAIVTKFEQRSGLSSELLVRDREMLVSGSARKIASLSPVRLRDIQPFKIVSPGPNNVHHRNLESYFQANGVRVDNMIEMEGIVGTLEFVAATDWVAILPAMICKNLQRTDLFANPIVDPPMHTDFMIVAPSRRPLNLQAQLFVRQFKTEMSCLERGQLSETVPRKKGPTNDGRAPVRGRA
jgi:LysR family transcriptional regulator, nitrogen assimilation regulatory protein